jgi:Domain of unknown function (DUF4145)
LSNVDSERVKKLSLYLKGNWYPNIEAVGKFSYNCGYCGNTAGPSKVLHCKYKSQNTILNSGSIYFCPTCNKPTFKVRDSDQQYPGEPVGDELGYLPSDIESLYSEAKNCISVNAFTSSVLSCRKILMNASVSKGAESGKSFAHYVTFLEENHYIPPNSREWVDHIRKKGNEATHEIPSIEKEDAIELIEFTTMLLRFIYELPGKMKTYKSK